MVSPLPSLLLLLPPLLLLLLAARRRRRNTCAGAGTARATAVAGGGTMESLQELGPAGGLIHCAAGRQAGSRWQVVERPAGQQLLGRLPAPASQRTRRCSQQHMETAGTLSARKALT